MPNNPKGLPRIGICIPIKGDFNPEFQDRVYIPLTTQVDWCQKLIFLSRVASVTVARNSVVKQALQANCDYILFVDSDVVMENPSNPNDALNQLYQIINKSKDSNDKNYKDARIVSGLYRAKQKTGFSYAMWLKEDRGFAPISKWNGNWLSVDVIGLGFCLIDTIVFKTLREKINKDVWFVWDDPDTMSEDFYFCQLAKEHGFSVMVFTDVKLSHLGVLKVKTDGTVTVSEV